MNAASRPNTHNPLSAMSEGETVIFAVKRHPIGLISMYLSFAVLIAIVAGLAVIAPDILTDYDSDVVRNVGVISLLFTVFIAGLFSMIAHIVYYGNRWILTSDSLTQITQKSLFDKQNSQLSLANLEDISAHQDGILAHIFNYGLLKVETAGEHSKFAFPYCPDPNAYAQKILIAREAFEQGEHYKTQEVPQQPTAVQPPTNPVPPTTSV
jgi:uncharacterized membrane protein YdbT with pleckstrin-like domain